MKKAICLILAVSMAMMLIACDSEKESLSSFEEGEVEKIVITLAMGNPDYGAKSKTITDKSEVEEFVQLFNSAHLGDTVDEGDLGVGAISTYAFHGKEKELKSFVFNVNDTNIVFWDSEPRYVIYGEGEINPFELYNSSSAKEITVDMDGNEMAAPLA